MVVRNSICLSKTQKHRIINHRIENKLLTIDLIHDKPLKFRASCTKISSVRHFARLDHQRR